MNKKKVLIILGLVILVIILFLLGKLIFNKFYFGSKFPLKTVSSTPTGLQVFISPPKRETLNGLTPEQNKKYGTNPNEVDNDHDGLPDWLEIKLGTNPNNPDTDGDGFPDGYEILHGYDPKGPGKIIK